MRSARAGDKGAYGALFRSITPILRAFVARRLGNAAEGEDVVQEILLSIHRASHTYDSARPFKIWMFAIARNRLSDYLRQAYRRNAGKAVNLDDIAEKIPNPDVTAETDIREYVNMMLDLLPEKQRRILTMMKVEGYSASDVAKELKMSVSAVKVSAHRAYKSIALKVGTGAEF